MHPNTPKTSTLRTLVIAVLSLFVLVSGVADVRRLSHPIGVFGTISDLDGVVVNVAPGSPADRAGIRPGDRFDIARLAPQDRWFLFPQNCTGSGVRITVGVIRGQTERMVALVAGPEPMAPPEQAAILCNIVAGVIFVVIGTVTVLLRPTLIVWGFYLFCLSSAPFPYREFDASLRLPLSFVWLVVLFAILSAGLPGLLVFSVRVLQDSIAGWRLWFERAAPVLFVVLASLQVIMEAENYIFGRPAQWMWNFTGALTLAAVLLIMCVLVVTYARAIGSDRQRIRWVVVGIGVALAAPYVQQLLPGLNTSVPALYDVIPVVGAAAPLGVAYAILKHRVV